MNKPTRGEVLTLADTVMNDAMGKTFPEIADYIEKKYLNNEEDKNG